MSDTLEPTPETTKTSSATIWIATAAGVFFFLTMADSFIATPLRQVSSVISHFLLELCSLPVTRQGTILTAGDLRFDVNPACSGSTTLKVLMGLGIYWCGTHPRLNVSRKIIGSCLTIPMALAANGIRVALLVSISYMTNTVIGEGTLHSFIGIVGFIVGMIGFFLIAESIALAEAEDSANDPVKLSFLGVLLFLIYSPFLVKYALFYTRVGAVEVYDRPRFLLVVVAIGTVIYSWRRTVANINSSRYAVIIFGISMVTVFLSLAVDITYLLGIGLLLSLLSFALAYKGKRFGISVIPLLGVAYLGFPHIAIQVNIITSKLLQLPTLNFSMLFRLPIVVFLFWLFARLRQRLPKETVSKAGIPKQFIHSALIMAAVLLAFQGYTYSIASQDSLEKRVSFSYIQGDWIGHDLPISDRTENFFGTGNIWMRKYVKGDHDIDVLINASGGNRHQNHPPEYCLTGSGWKIEHTEKVVRKIGVVGEIEMTAIHLTNDGRSKTFLYWFTDGNIRYSDYMGMTVQDTLRRLAGRRTNWFLFRVFTSFDDKKLNDFLESFDFAIHESEVRSVQSP